MKLSSVCGTVAAAASLASATIWQNDQVRITHFPNTTIDPSGYKFKNYSPNSTELSYKGRWDSHFTSWYSVPGLKFGFTGNRVAITFGPETFDTTLVGYRIDGQDWQFTNVSTGATHLLVNSNTTGVSLTYPTSPSTFEMRVTNWAYGVQIAAVHVKQGEKLIKIPDFPRTIKVIGDSLSAGMYASYEGLSSFAYGLGAGLGNSEYSVTAYPGICLFDKLCWGNPHRMLYQWFRTSDTSWRAQQAFGDNPEWWDFSKKPAADIVVLNLGTNDNNSANNVTAEGYVAQYKMLVQGVHKVYPKAQIILMALWEGFSPFGNTYAQSTLISDVGYVPQIYSVYEYFNTKEYLANPILYDPVYNTTYPSNQTSAPFVHYFNTTGLMQHNDIGPQWHPTDAGHIKVASHLIQYIKMKFDWVLYATGPEIFHDTLYWNDNSGY
ncbi:GDSL-like Lipase/Acylhydrolase-like protein [Hyaloscypha sp. PMI_1271]|nr:GDSL-like Lipase/Acylhydrolase-like protein [Hyaloscypha sp. PMI_1271]